ncbi:MAG: hypothetical protein A2259_01615 [Candidatus Moranbacteria bacterium RIFOXYA2_FULL_43_15]|nr:MAG: hypothetical protein A2259_01615 [Candidatus Moranbacteria bacterium RIFOXYA2_FULL_43_15]
MPKETEQQYTAWLLYCEAGSIQKTLRLWDRVGQSLGETWVEFVDRIGKKPSDTTIESWSKKFRWVERKDLKLTEDLEGLRKKAQEIKQKKVFIIGEIFWEKLQALKKQMKKGEGASVDEIKKLWEMFRTEMGESLGKHELSINEDEQKPPTPEEMELGAVIDDAIEKFYDRNKTAKK